MTTRCLRCGQRTKGSYCAACARKRRAIYDRDRNSSAAIVRASPRCAKCGSTTDLTADHIIPISEGGAGGPRRVLCRTCNSSRGANTDDVDATTSSRSRRSRIGRAVEAVTHPSAGAR
jgi:5-methylcytosine-specific restriction endonuclease McrA